MSYTVGWYYGNPRPYWYGEPGDLSDTENYDPDTEGGGDGIFTGCDFFAGICGLLGGETVVWSGVWTPLASDSSPDFAPPDGGPAWALKVHSAEYGTANGALVLRATVNGIELPDYLTLTLSVYDGYYLTAAWIRTVGSMPSGGGGLPELLAPVELCYLAAGNAITPESLYDDFSLMSGHDRKRKVQTYAPQVVSVEAILEPAQARFVDDWFENVLNVGVEQFSARVARLGPNSSYWRAEWVSPIQWEPMALGRWRISGELLLTGEGREFPPLTTTLEIEFGMALTGTAAIYAPVELEFEFGMALRAHNPFAFEFAMALTNPSFELREDGGFELREDDGFEWRN